MSFIILVGGFDSCQWVRCIFFRFWLLWVRSLSQWVGESSSFVLACLPGFQDLILRFCYCVWVYVYVYWVGWIFWNGDLMWIWWLPMCGIEQAALQSLLLTSMTPQGAISNQRWTKKEKQKDSIPSYDVDDNSVPWFSSFHNLFEFVLLTLCHFNSHCLCQFISPNHPVSNLRVFSSRCLCNWSNAISVDCQIEICIITCLGYLANLKRNSEHSLFFGENVDY